MRNYDIGVGFLAGVDVLRVAYEVATFGVWLEKLCSAALECAQDLAGRTAMITHIGIEGNFARCSCEIEIEHWLLVGFSIDLARDPLFADEHGEINNQKTLQFLDAWTTKYADLMDTLPPNIEVGTMRKIMSNSRPLMLRGTAFHMSAREMEIPDSDDDHTAAFMDFARRGDEASFRDLARMALPNLEPAEIDEMWAGTLRRVKRQKVNTE